MQVFFLNNTYTNPVCFQSRKKVKLAKIATKEVLPALNKSVQKAEEKHNLNFGQIVTPQGILSKTEKFRTGIKDERLKMLEVEKWQNQVVYPEEGIEYPPNYTFVDAFGLTRLKPHLYIQGIQVKKAFRHQGVCKDIEHQIVEKSKEAGCEGRVILFADYMNNDIAKVPPSIAHYKSGFRFPTDSQNIIMEQILRGELPVSEAPLGFMFYPV